MKFHRARVFDRASMRRHHRHAIDSRTANAATTDNFHPREPRVMPCLCVTDERPKSRMNIGFAGRTRGCDDTIGARAVTV